MSLILHPRQRFLRFALACSHELLGVGKISPDDYHELEMLALLHKKEIPDASLLERHYPNACKAIHEIAARSGCPDDPWTHRVVSEVWHVRHRTDDTPAKLFTVELPRADGFVLAKSVADNEEDTYRQYFYDRYGLRLPEGARIWTHINWIIEGSAF